MSESITLLEAINNGDVSLVLDQLADNRPIDLNEPYPWDASKTNSPFATPTSNLAPLKLHPGSYNCTALNLAVLTGNKSIVRILLQSGADPNREDGRHRNALVCALYGIDSLKMQADTFSYLSSSLIEHIEILRILIPHMIISTMNKPLNSLSGTSVLCFACYLGKIDAVKLLLDCEHIAVNAVDCKGATALMYAVREGHQAIVRELINHKAQPELTNQEGFSALQYARNSPIITYELERYLAQKRIAQLDLQSSPLPLKQFCTLLTSTIERNSALLFKEGELKEFNRSEPSLNEEHHTFLNFIQEGDYDKVHRMIIEYFKPPLNPNKASLINFHEKSTGLTPAHKAVGKSTHGVLLMESLFIAGADLNSTSWSGRTPLHHLCLLAVQSLTPNTESSTNNSNSLGLVSTAPTSSLDIDHFVQLADRLIKLGALINVVDKKGKTPLHYASKGDDSLLPLVNLLLENGSDSLALDQTNKSPAEVAECPAIITRIRQFRRKSVAKSLIAPISRVEERISTVSETPEASIVSPQESPIPSTVLLKSSISEKLSLGQGIQDFLDQYRIFDSAIALDWLPILKGINLLVISRVLAGRSRHQFHLTSPTEVAKFNSLVEVSSLQMDKAYQLFHLLSHHKDIIINELYENHYLFIKSKENLDQLWKFNADLLPLLKNDLKTLSSGLNSLSSECGFLVKALGNKRVTFMQEFQRLMMLQKSNMQSNNQALEDILGSDSIESVESASQLSAAGIEKSDEEAAHSDNDLRTTASLETKFNSLVLSSKEIQLDMDITKAKLAELCEQKNIVLSQFKLYMGDGSNRHNRRDLPKSRISISFSDLAFQAEVLTDQHEKLLANLERLIDENERLADEIIIVRDEMDKVSPIKRLEHILESSNNNSCRPTPLQRSTSLSSGVHKRKPSICLSDDQQASSRKLVDLMLQIQAIDLALFSLNTWIPYRTRGLRSISTDIDNTLEGLSAGVEEFQSSIVWFDQYTEQIKTSILNKETSLNQTIHLRENWLARVRKSMEEAKDIKEDTAVSHSLKQWSWDFENGFRQCQSSNLEHSCLELSTLMESNQSYLESTHSKLQSFSAQIKFQDQFIKTKLHSSDPKHLGGLHELHRLEVYLDKIKTRDSNNLSNLMHGRSHSFANTSGRRASSIFGTPELVPSSPTSSFFSNSPESNFDINYFNHKRMSSEDLAKNVRHSMYPTNIEFNRQSSYVNEGYTRSRRSSSRTTNSIDFSASLPTRFSVRSSTDGSLKNKKSSLINTTIHEDSGSKLTPRPISSSLAELRLRRSISIHGLKSVTASSNSVGLQRQSSTLSPPSSSAVPRSPRPVSAYRSLRMSGSVANFRPASLDPTTNLLSPAQLGLKNVASSQQLRTKTIKLNQPDTMQKVRTATNSAIKESPTELRRIASELYSQVKLPGYEKVKFQDPNTPTTPSISSSNTSEDGKSELGEAAKQARDRLHAMLLDTKREVDILQRLVTKDPLPPTATELEQRQYKLLTKKRQQVRQMTFALQKLDNNTTANIQPTKSFRKHDRKPTTLHATTTSTTSPIISTNPTTSVKLDAGKQSLAA